MSDASQLKMTAQEVEDLVHVGFEHKTRRWTVERVEAGRARVRVPYRESMLRPGRVLSGPSLFAAADVAMYVLVLAHVGPQLMAVTANFNINFLAKAKPGDILADARMLKLGRRLAVMEVGLYSSAEPEVRVAHVTGSYALPSARPAPAEAPS
jgi:uncharacterized protein (TIGR00369 family)